MPAQNHPAYREELERCQYTLEYARKSLDSAAARKERVDRDVDRAKRHLNSDSSQGYIDMLINTQLQGGLALKLRNLVTATSKPYFARIDFKEEGKKAAEKLYIGKMSLMREEDQEVIIVDWRAPIANLYYEGRLGEASYNCPDGNIDGELRLKRQFSINDGILQEIFDIDITTNDEFLQTYLGANADNRLKEIVSTIQVEQNQIIRADMWTPLIVQGAAGSGKTTIALHRIAYLIYTYEKSFEPENFMIIAPSRFFLNYISEVLPELGVERVKQSTFQDFAVELIGKKLKIKDGNEKLKAFVNQGARPEEAERNKLSARCSELKSSMQFKKMMDRYVSTIEANFIPKEDFKIGNKSIYKYQDINDLFLREYKRWPIAYRINEIKKHLTSRLKLKRDEIINQLHDQCDMRIMHLKEKMEPSEERQKLIVEAIDKKNAILGKLESYCKTAVKAYIARISKLNPYEYYRELINDPELFATVAADEVDGELLDFTREYTLETLDAGLVEIEDIAPILYLKYCIHGIDEKIPVRHIVIDEAQDFNVFQLYVLKKIVKDSSFTILGDLCQGIHSYRGIKDWDEVKQSVFEDTKCQILTLEQSYRTTVEIMEAANKVIRRARDSKLILAKPVIRHGSPVKVVKKEGMKEIASDMASRIEALRKNGFKSVAVIGKTENECKDAYTLLKKEVDGIYMITGKEDVYKGGVVIVPAYLSKGLEFDAVMIINANKDEYREDDLDVKLLYVSMTRPLHELLIYYHGELSPLLEEVAEA